MRKVCLVLAITTAFCFQKVNGQSITPQVIASTGGFALAGSYSLSFTSGEAATLTLNAGSSILTQGFQQPNDISLAVKNIHTASFDGVQVYPNPTLQNVFVSLPASAVTESFTVQLVDVTGRMLAQTNSLNEHSATIMLSMSHYAAGTYLLNVIDPERNSSAYKIIKLK